MTRRAVVFVNGELPEQKFLLPLLKPGDYFIAVDGGLHHLKKLSKVPDLLIGDLDSVSESELHWADAQGTEIRRYNIEKDETDLELALLAAVEKGFEEILILAALGGRVDQTLANLFLLTLLELTNVKVVIESGVEEIILIRDRTEIMGRSGDIVSLLPLNGQVAGVQTWDLKYPLNKETLLPEKSRGISNVMLKDQAEVAIDSGCLLCIHTRKRNEEKK